MTPLITDRSLDSDTCNACHHHDGTYYSKTCGECSEFYTSNFCYKTATVDGLMLVIDNPPHIKGVVAIELDPDHGTDLAWLLSRYRHQHGHQITVEDALKLAILDAADTLRSIEECERAP